MRVAQTSLGSNDVNAVQESMVVRWEDLLPSPDTAPEANPYAALLPHQLERLAMLARMVRLIATGKADAEGSMARSADRLRAEFAQQRLDADWLIAQRDLVRQDRIRRSFNPDVEGKSVRLLGAVAPLSWDEHTGVSDFFLTTAMGKCSHVPAPPYNQVTFVHTEQPIDVNTLIKEQGISDPWVWVEGTIRYSASTHQVYRGDGMMRIEAAYEIEPLRIVSASAAELARQAEQAKQAAEALLFPSLTDLVNAP